MIKQFIRLDNPFCRSNPFYIPQSYSLQKLSQSYRRKSPSYKAINQNNYNRSIGNLYKLEYNGNQNLWIQNSEIKILMNNCYRSGINNFSKYQQSSLKKHSKKLENPFFRRNLLQSKQINHEQNIQLKEYQFKNVLPDFSNIVQQHSVDKKAKISPISNIHIQQMIDVGITAEKDSSKQLMNIPSKSLIMSFSRVKTQKSIKGPSLSKIPSVDRQQKYSSIQKLNLKNLNSEPDIITLKGKLYSKIQIGE